MAYVMHYTDPRDGVPYTHMHFESASRDCDGRYDRTGVQRPNDGETFRQSWDWRVAHERRFLHSEDPNGYEHSATLTLEDQLVESYDYTYHEDGRDEEILTGQSVHPVMVVSKQTDEGFSRVLWRPCAEVYCLHEKSTFRDHTAESMGY